MEINQSEKYGVLNLSLIWLSLAIVNLGLLLADHQGWLEPKQEARFVGAVDYTCIGRGHWQNPKEPKDEIQLFIESSNGLLGYDYGAIVASIDLLPIYDIGRMVSNFKVMAPLRTTQARKARAPPYFV